MRHDDLVSEIADRYWTGEVCSLTRNDAIYEFMREYDLSLEKAVSVYDQADFLASYLMKV
jgi:hypothetical protein